MFENLFLQGAVIGFAIAAPVGPIGLLCIRRTLSKGRISGLTSGIGAATADAVYGFVAAFGLSLIGHLLLEARPWLGLGGGLFLIYLGVAEWRTTPPPFVLTSDHSAAGLLRGFATTFLLTLANPMTIIGFTAIFAGLGIVGPDGAIDDPERDTRQLLLLVAGVFLGSASWWLLLSGVAGFVRRRLGPATLHWLNRISGTALIAFGVYALTLALRWL